MKSTESIELDPVLDDPSVYEQMEQEITKAFFKLLYDPLLKVLLGKKTSIKNDQGALLRAIQKGAIAYDGKTFSGRFDAKTTKALKDLGAKWHSRTGTFHLAEAEIPVTVKMALAVGKSSFLARVTLIQRTLEDFEPSLVTDTLDLTPHFKKAISAVDIGIRKSLPEDISIPLRMTEKQKVKVASDWQNNMDLWIKDFTEQEIKTLRQKILKNVQSGNRYDALLKTITRSYGVTVNKARFLARQETQLLVTKLKEVRYNEAGITKYRWTCVVGSKLHPVRPAHKALDGEIFSWNDPPITSEPSQPVRRNNPGQDYNCRCFARPIVDFRSKDGS